MKLLEHNEALMDVRFRARRDLYARRMQAREAAKIQLALLANRAERISREFASEMKLRKSAGVRLDGHTIRPIKHNMRGEW